MKFILLFILLPFSSFCFAQDPILHHFKIGAKWIYETLEHPLPIRYSYVTYQITDTTEIAGQKVFVIENDFRDGPEYMLIEDGRIYFWDSPTNAFQLDFDFNSDSTYQVPWRLECGKESGIAEVIIDSTSSAIFGNDTFSIQNITLKNNGNVTNDLQLQVVRNVGLMSNFRLPVGGCPFADFNINITRLRCFEVDTIHYNFTGIPCDSSWFTLASYDPQSDLITLHPNPSQGEILIKGIDHDIPYQLYTIDGSKVEEGVTTGFVIASNVRGLMLVRLEEGHRLIWQRVIFL